MTSVVKPADWMERERALDPARSFIVQAPAGSGKTTLLVERFLVLLKQSRKPEEVVAITFTRKAAAEMRKRVLQKLPNAGEIAHRLRIETIDAFCASLARQLPVPAQFGVPPGIVEDAEALYREAASATLALLEDDAWAGPIGTLLAHLDNNVGTATTLLAAMLARRDQWLTRTGAARTRAELEAAFVQEREKLLGRARQLDPRASEEFAFHVLTQKNTFNKKKKEAVALEGNEELRLALIPLKTLPPEKYEDAQWTVLEAILKLLPAAAAQLKLVFAARGEADFTEIAQGAVRALGSADDPSDLLLALDQKIHHLLVDEFQDTSISQWELLERLTAGWQPDDGRTLFVVGDPMQSIYRFREAVVGLFLRARREGLPNVKLEPLALTANFRSQAGLVGFFNAMFREVLPAREDEASGAVPYSPATPVHPALPGEAAMWHGCPDSVLEAKKVVQLVKEAEGSCALLVRNRTALADIVPALKDAGLRFRAIEIEHLGEKQVVQDLYALTRALTHLGDRVAWLALLRAPWVGFSLEDLSRHFEGKPSQTIWELVQDIPSLSRFRAVLGEALAHSHRGSLRSRVERAWLALGGPACLSDAASLEDADAYLDALEALEEAGEVDFARLEESLDELYAQPDPAAGDADLQIMTIHKAKGLEFDTVIVPGLQRPPRNPDPPLMRWKELPDTSLLLAPIRETGREAEPAYEYLKDLDREAEDTEASRLLYVAATRAIRRLHLTAVLKTDDDGSVKPPNKRSLLGRAWAYAASQLPASLPPQPAPAADHIRPPQTLYRLPADFKLPPPPAPVRWAPPTETRDEEPIEFSWAGETARHVGTVVHRWLQRIAEDELKGWDANRVESLRSRFEMDISRRGVKDPGPAVELVVTALKNTLADERGRWILGPHPGVKSEFRVRGVSGSYVVDRLLETEDGSRWVIDYKTGRQEGGDLDRFLGQELERYRLQLDQYKKLVGANHAGLYFPHHKGWREST
jgi:ATP-dependent exoDNAse (exonuclease V) beta subunit